MLVKNSSDRPIRIGRQVIAKNAVEDVPESMLLQPRVQRLRASQKLVFPWSDRPSVVVPDRLPAPPPPEEIAPVRFKSRRERDTKVK